MSKFYEKYWNERGDELGDFSLKWPKLAPFVPRGEGVAILDFGCGAGHLIEEMHRLNPAARFMGVDVSREALARARARCPYAQFFEDHEGASSIPDASADFVLSSEVIEHVYDTEQMASEIARVLKPGGKLLLTTPYHGFLKNLAITLFGFDRHFDPTGPHVRFFSRRTLTALLERHALRVIQYGYYGRMYPFSHSIVVLAEKHA